MIATEFYSATQALPDIPDNLTVAQFMLDYHHSIQPERNGIPCLVDDKTSRRVGIEELRERTYGLANSLNRRFGISENDIVLIFSPNHIDFPVALWAIHRLGGIVTFSNPLFTPEELSYQLITAKVTLVIAHSSVLDTAFSAAKVAGLPSDRIVSLDRVSSGYEFRIPDVCGLISEGLDNEPSFEERTLEREEGKKKVALLCWSSGTTGNPKAVAIAHFAFIANIVQMAAHNQVGKSCSLRDSRGYRPGDVAFAVLPFYHVAGLVINLHLVLFCGMTAVVAQRFNLLDTLDSIVRHRITHLMLVPPLAIAICKNPLSGSGDFTRIKYVMIGAAPVSREVQERLFQIFPNAQIGQAYGLTEMTTTLAMVPVTQKRGPLGSGGQLLPGVQARVVKPDGSLAGYGESGELVVKGPSAALGYFMNESATRETFVDGWVHTGDEVAITQNQEVFVFDRLKELLKVNGYQVAPAELEDCLLGHPDVDDSCVVGIPDSYSGEVPLAFVVLSIDAQDRVMAGHDGLESIRRSIAQHVAERKVRYKHLKGGVQFVDMIPKNGSGKILRRVLRDKAKEALQTRARL